MNNEDKAVSQYLKEINGRLTCSNAMKSVFLTQLKEDIADYRAKGQPVTLEALQARFGTPEDISRGFLERDGYEELLDKEKRKIRFWKTLTATMVALFLLTVVFFLLSAYVTSKPVVAMNPR